MRFHRPLETHPEATFSSQENLHPATKASSSELVGVVWYQQYIGSANTEYHKIHQWLMACAESRPKRRVAGEVCGQLFFPGISCCLR